MYRDPRDIFYDEALEELMEDSLTDEDVIVINELREMMNIDDDDDALCALYNFELYFFNKGRKTANKTFIVNFQS